MRGGGGGGRDTEANFPNPPPPLPGRRDGKGCSRRGCPTCRSGGVVNPTSMAQNDTHVALIILTTQMWGGGIIGGKNFFGAKSVFLRLWRQHPFLHKTKRPTRNPISPTPPLLRRASMSAPPPAEQFSGRPGNCHRGASMLYCLLVVPRYHISAHGVVLCCHPAPLHFECGLLLDALDKAIPYMSQLLCATLVCVLHHGVETV